MKSRLKGKVSLDQLVQTKLGDRVIYGDRELLYEEAPEACKKVELVIQNLLDEGPILVVAIMRPLLTFKTGGKKYHK